MPELLMTAAAVNQYPAQLYHSYTRSAYARSGPDLPIPRCWTTFRLTARSRGKELRIDLLPVTIDPVARREEERERAATAAAAASPTALPSPNSPAPKRARRAKKSKEEKSEEEQEKQKEEEKTEEKAKKVRKPLVRVHPPSPVIPLDGPLPILLRMGMSGHMVAYSDPSRTHPHAHLTFHSSSPSPLAMCFVDQRRFGRWQITADWDRTRSPCPYSEYALFRRHVLAAVARRRKPLEHPLCEVLLNQAFFNGIGNYLRAEICQRAGVSPFANARSVLEGLQEEEMEEEAIEVDGARRRDGPDILRLCRDVCAEVVEFGSRSGVGRKRKEMAEEEKEADRAVQARRRRFRRWLRCYKRWDLGMVSTRDSKKRTMWHERRHWQEGKTQEGPRKVRRARAGPKEEELKEEAKEDAEENIDSGEAEGEEEGDDSEEEEAEATPTKAKRGRAKRAKGPPPPAPPAVRERNRKEKAMGDEAIASERAKESRQPRGRKRAVKAAAAAEGDASAALEGRTADEVQETSPAPAKRRKKDKDTAR